MNLLTGFSIDTFCEDFMLMVNKYIYYRSQSDRPLMCIAYPIQYRSKEYSWKFLSKIPARQTSLGWYLMSHDPFLPEYIAIIQIRIAIMTANTILREKYLA